MEKLVIPSEEVEQRTLVEYCRIRQIPFFRVPSETYTTSWSQKRKNKELGVVKGIPDLFVIANNKLIAIEMKRIRGSTTSTEQKEWIKRLVQAGVQARVCRGFVEAKEFIKEQYEVSS